MAGKDGEREERQKRGLLAPLADFGQFIRAKEAEKTVNQAIEEFEGTKSLSIETAQEVIKDGVRVLDRDRNGKLSVKDIDKTIGAVERIAKKQGFDMDQLDPEVREALGEIKEMYAKMAADEKQAGGKGVPLKKINEVVGGILQDADKSGNSDGRLSVNELKAAANKLSQTEEFKAVKKETDRMLGGVIQDSVSNQPKQEDQKSENFEIPFGGGCLPPPSQPQPTVRDDGKPIGGATPPPKSYTPPQSQEPLR